MGVGGSDPTSVQSASCPRDIVELFNVYFSSVLNGNDNPIDSITPPSTTGCESTLSELNLCLDDVLIVLLNLDTNKATCPKLALYQRNGNWLSSFQFSRKETKPTLRTIVRFHSSASYRGLRAEQAACSPVGKINTSQHGFIPGRSCTTQLVEVLNSIGSLLDSGKQTDVIFMDMSKAFGKVSHAALIAKLERYNISGSLLDWFSSYLYNRRQRVTTLGATSSEKTVSSGVPQGSILGPILFFLYVNDLPDVVKNSSVACFADDTKIFRRVDSICDADLLQTDLSNLDSWSTSSGLVFNQLKCKCLRVPRKNQPVLYPYTIKDNELTTTSAEKDLGNSGF
ncbi:Hypothetical predicted protein [Paramuricea clavata]|uniref:Uncharacterized protein n=1 Tax=Paramuricea clavata TaxID=317549 RepID=A0A7D9JE15_PARCT|nr:Hypothetical predicted protein [Paramuricea clavata]